MGILLGVGHGASDGESVGSTKPVMKGTTATVSEGPYVVAID